MKVMMRLGLICNIPVQVQRRHWVCHNKSPSLLQVAEDLPGLERQKPMRSFEDVSFLITLLYYEDKMALSTPVQTLRMVY